MNLLAAALAFLLSLVLALVAATRLGAWLIERRHPPEGSFADIDGTRLRYVHVPAPGRPELPPLVFFHGATANLKDQMVPLRPVFEGRAEMLFVDRPGHGWSSRGRGNETPSGQAATIAALMQRLGISEAILVGHSFGAAVAAAFAVEQPQRTRGLVFLSAASHPWPGGNTSWYYDLAAMPLAGQLFVETLTYPAGRWRMAEATRCVFHPNPVPADYGERASIPLVLRPAAFRANAVDVAGLYRYVREAASRYRQIAVPTVVVSGDSDAVVYEEIHSIGLARDIQGAELVWVRNLGHKPDWIAPDLVAAAVERAAGLPRDLQAAARAVEARIAGDAAGAAPCEEAAAPAAELAPQ